MSYLDARIQGESDTAAAAKRMEYLATRTDGTLLGMYRSVITLCAVARYRMELEHEAGHQDDLNMIERELYARLRRFQMDGPLSPNKEA